MDVTDPARPEIVIGNRTRYLSQYFRYVRRGAVRIMAASKDDAFDPVAFVNPDGGYVVVIKADSGGELSIGGLPAGVYGVNYTTAEAFNVDGPERSVSADGVLDVGIPESGVLSIYKQ